MTSHPTSNKMVLEAVESLNDGRQGSSLQAIKKFISEVYEVDMGKMAPHIRKAVKKHVEDGNLIQTKGKGASGSFRLSSKAPSSSAAAAAAGGPGKKIKVKAPSKKK